MSTNLSLNHIKYTYSFQMFCWTEHIKYFGYSSPGIWLKIFIMGLMYVANVALWERLLSLKDIKDRCVSTSLPQTK